MDRRVEMTSDNNLVIRASTSGSTQVDEKEVDKRARTQYSQEKDTYTGNKPAQHKKNALKAIRKKVRAKMQFEIDTKARQLIKKAKKSQ